MVVTILEPEDPIVIIHTESVEMAFWHLLNQFFLLPQSLQLWHFMEPIDPVETAGVHARTPLLLALCHAAGVAFLSVDIEVHECFNRVRVAGTKSRATNTEALSHDTTNRAHKAGKQADFAKERVKTIKDCSDVSYMSGGGREVIEACSYDEDSTIVPTLQLCLRNRGCGCQVLTDSTTMPIMANVD
ncbi:hypothetical protein Nepgr_030821 [Nepenthes gracilis]|uniref:Uncharacterized protein n=1 Tax=Nepenthes gracilis TaxID=150966 RepID=A0AAD3Y4L4_NEPGR|nr:hypothetical protein Nepgr_030821 [Nepenthes gracilis]